MKILPCVLLSASTAIQVGALQFDRDGQPVHRVDDDIISGYPSQPGCYVRQPSKCPAKPMKTAMWRHDTWAEERGLNETACRDRKGFWDRYCEAEDTKVLHIRGEAGDELGPREPEPERSRRETVPRTDSDIVSGTPSQAGCYFRQPSKCPAKPMKTALWRHDAEAEQRGLDETGCRDRKGFWDRHCDTDDTKVMYIRGVAQTAASSVRVEGPPDSGEAATQQRDAARRAVVIKALTDAQEAREKARAVAAQGAQREAEEQAMIDAAEEKAADEATAAQEVFPENARAATEEAAKREMAQEALKAELESAKDEHTPSDVALEVAEASWAWGSTGLPQQAPLREAKIGAAEETQPAAQEEGAAQGAAPEVGATETAEEAQIRAAARIAEAEEEAQVAEEAASMADDPGVRMPPRSEEAPKAEPEGAASGHTASDEALMDAEAGLPDARIFSEPPGAAGGRAASDEALVDSEASRRTRTVWRSAGGPAEGVAEGGDGAESAQQLAQVSTLAEDSGAPPAEPGCYMKMPTGCEARQTEAQRWLRDKWAGGGVLDSAGCMGRRSVWNDYCKRKDVEVVFVGGRTGSEASSERISEHFPSSQRGEVMLQLGDVSSWPWSRKRETHVELPDAKAKAGADSELSNPSEPGCYMRMPSGCPKNPMRTDLWRHDAWAEHHGLDEEGCKGRKQVWDKYCETSDSKMVSVGNTTT